MLLIPPKIIVKALQQNIQKTRFRKKATLNFKVRIKDTSQFLGLIIIKGLELNKKLRHLKEAFLILLFYFGFLLMFCLFIQYHLTCSNTHLSTYLFSILLQNKKAIQLNRTSHWHSVQERPVNMRPCTPYPLKMKKPYEDTRATSYKPKNYIL